MTFNMTDPSGFIGRKLLILNSGNVKQIVGVPRKYLLLKTKTCLLPLLNSEHLSLIDF